MFRILKPEKNYFKKFLMKKYRLYKHEDIGFVAATLSRMRNKLENYIEEKNYNYFPSDGFCFFLLK